MDNVCQIKKKDCLLKAWFLPQKKGYERSFIIRRPVAVSVRGFDFRLIDIALSALLSHSVCYNLISPVTPLLFLNCMYGKLVINYTANYKSYNSLHCLAFQRVFNCLGLFPWQFSVSCISLEICLTRKMNWTTKFGLSPGTWVMGINKIM